MFKKLAGFSIIGASLTILSMGLMYLFHNVLKFHHQVAYVCSYVIPLIFSFILNSIFVFKTNKNIRNMVVYFSIYLSSMFTGMILLAFFKLTIPLDATLLSYMALPVTSAQNFTLNHLLLKKSEPF